MRRTLPAVLGFAVLVLSPQAACVDEDEGLSPAQIDALRESVEGTWEYTDGTTTLQLRLTHSSRDFDPEEPYASRSVFFNEAYACGSHGLVKPANACIDVYYMPFDVEVIAGNAPDSRATLMSFGGGTSSNEMWVKLGSTELRGQLANEMLTIEGGSARSLRRIAF